MSNERLFHWLLVVVLVVYLVALPFVVKAISGGSDIDPGY